MDVLQALLVVCKGAHSCMTDAPSSMRHSLPRHVSSSRRVAVQAVLPLMEAGCRERGTLAAAIKQAFDTVSCLFQYKTNPRVRYLVSPTRLSLEDIVSAAATLMGKDLISGLDFVWVTPGMQCVSEKHNMCW